MSEFAPVLMLVAVGGAYLLFRFLKKPFDRSRLSQSDFVVFEAYPVHLDGLKADMTEAGWRFASSTPSSDASASYRFEKTGPNSANLADVIDGKAMPRTANRTIGADLLIKVSEHGKRSA